MIKIPRVIRVDPKNVIPFHSARAIPRFTVLYRAKLFSLVPPIPIIRVPKDLSHIGEFINYNGHHRTKSAIEAQVNPLAYLIQSDEDIKFLESVSDTYAELIEGLGTKFPEHYDFVCKEAMRYNNLKQ